MLVAISRRIILFIISSWKLLISAERCITIGAGYICREPNYSFWNGPWGPIGTMPQVLSFLHSISPFIQRGKWLIEIQGWLLFIECLCLHFNVARSLDLNHCISKGRFEFRRDWSWRSHYEGGWGRKKRLLGALQTISWILALHSPCLHHPARDWVHSRFLINTLLFIDPKKRMFPGSLTSSLTEFETGFKL